MRTHESVYFSGVDYFAALFTALDQAQSEILIETYIFEEGNLTQQLYAKLEAAVKRGVAIKIMVDAAGSHGQIEKLRNFCIAHHIALKVFHPILWAHLINTLRFLNRRNHRKVCVIDSTLAFAGSMNFCDEHIQDGPWGKAWKDYGTSFQGSGVTELIRSFEKAFHKLKLSKRLKKVLMGRELNDKDSALFLNDNRHRRRECYRNLKARIRSAQKRIWLANAYILPELRIQKHLEEAAKRGVDVRLLSNGDSSDIFFMPWLLRLFCLRNLKAGIKLFEYLPSFFHGKVFVFDEYISIGSSNLNHRSVFHDLEVDVVITETKNQRLVSEDLAKCFEQSKALCLTNPPYIPIWQKLIARILYLFKYWF